MLAAKQSQPENTVKAKNNAPFFPGHLVQPKLQVNEPGDSYEQEADSMADQVMHMNIPSPNESSFFKPAPTTVQRKCQHCEEEEKLQRKESSDASIDVRNDFKPILTTIQRKCQHCEEEGKIHRKESSGVGVNGSVELDSYVGSLGSSGQALSESSRSFFEPRFGQDFSGVRIHTDAVAAKSAQSINALAYTTGNNIVFNSGQYSPDSDSGKRLIAHELTHTIQQQESNVSRMIQRTVDNVEVNCGDNQIKFSHDGAITSYNLDHCNVTDGQYNATVRLSPARVDFDLGTVGPGIQFDFGYAIGPGQPSPNTFFVGQTSVSINCTHTPSASGDGTNIHFNASRLTPEEFTQLTGSSIDSLPEGMMVPLGNLLSSVAGPAVAGASHFSPTPWSFIPRNTTGILWGGSHTSVWSNPEGLFSSPTIRGYRGNLGYYMGEYAPIVGHNFTVRLHEGVPGSFANDAWFPMMAGDQYYIFTPQTPEQGLAFAQRLRSTEHGGTYTYSPPRATGASDPILGPVGATEGDLNAELLSRGRAPMCTNNCITVPRAEVEAAIGGRPATPSGVDVMSGTGPDGAVDPAFAGRGRLMTEAMRDGPLPPGAQRLRIRVTPGGSAGMFVIRGAGGIMLVYGIYQTTDRIASSVGTGHTTTVITEEAGSWTGGILGSALGGAAAGAVLCSPTGPVDAVCVVGGFLGGLLFGAIGGAAGHAVGHEVGEHVATPIVDSVIQQAAEVESSMTRSIYNLYGVPYF